MVYGDDDKPSEAVPTAEQVNLTQAPKDIEPTSARLTIERTPAGKLVPLFNGKPIEGLIAMSIQNDQSGDSHFVALVVGCAGVDFTNAKDPNKVVN